MSYILTIHGDSAQESYYVRKVDDIWYLGPEGKHPCVQFQINKKKGKATLNMVNYFRYCNLNKNMERKDGTRLMMQAMILCMHKRYPSLNEFEFSDESYVQCDGNDADLAMRNLLCYGQTWYMEMGAVSKSLVIRLGLEAAKTKLAGKMDMALETFMLSLPDYDVQKIRPIHTACYKKDSWNHFFKKLYDLDCHFFLIHNEAAMWNWVYMLGIPDPHKAGWLFPLEVVDSWASTYQIKLKRNHSQEGGGSISWPEKPPVLKSYLPD